MLQNINNTDSVTIALFVLVFSVVFFSIILIILLMIYDAKINYILSCLYLTLIIVTYYGQHIGLFILSLQSQLTYTIIKKAVVLFIFKWKLTRFLISSTSVSSIVYVWMREWRLTDVSIKQSENPRKSTAKKLLQQKHKKGLLSRCKRFAIVW